MTALNSSQNILAFTKFGDEDSAFQVVSYFFVLEWWRFCCNCQSHACKLHNKAFIIPLLFIYLFFWNMEVEAEMLFQFLNVGILNGLDHFREEQMVWIYLAPTKGCSWQLLRWEANKWSLKWRNSLSLNL